MSEISGCSLCSDPESTENPVLNCNGCNLKVHILCYGVESFGENWMCSPCLESADQPVCKLCVQSGGALKKTTCGGWVHVLCGLFIEGCEFLDKNLMEPVDIKNVSDSKRNKMCIYCQNDQGFASSCDQSKCKNRLHITCAQKNGCLKEKEDRHGKIKFRAYCLDHKPVDSTRRISSEFVRGAIKKKQEKSAGNTKKVEKSSKAKKRLREKAEKENSSKMNTQWLFENLAEQQTKQKPTAHDGSDVDMTGSLKSMAWDSYDQHNPPCDFNSYSFLCTPSTSKQTVSNEGNKENISHACFKDEKIMKVSKKSFSVKLKLHTTIFRIFKPFSTTTQSVHFVLVFKQFINNIKLFIFLFTQSISFHIFIVVVFL